MPSSDKPSNAQDSSAFNLEVAMVNAWQTQAWWLWLLWPISALYGGVTYIRRKLYQQGLLASYKAPIPVMVVGNITVGGSGKTPLIIELVTFLQKKGIKVGVISRGYGGDESLMPQIVTTQSQPNKVGDEPCLIVAETGAVVAVCPNRQLAIESILKQQPQTQLIIADDGLQHYKLQRDIEWVVVDNARGFGNKQLLPTGFLREPISRLQGSTVIYHNSANKPVLESNMDDDAGTDSEALLMHLEPSALRPLTTDQPNFNEDFYSVYAVSGIGYPQRFFNTLQDLGYKVTAKPMPDHHKFTAEDLLGLTNKPIIITSKDAVKIGPLVASDARLQTLSIWVLPVQAVLTANCYTKLTQQIKSVGIPI